MHNLEDLKIPVILEESALFKGVSKEYLERKLSETKKHIATLRATLELGSIQARAYREMLARYGEKR